MEKLEDIELPKRETAPFVWDFGSRVLKGALIGYGVGLVFFKSPSTRRFLFWYGAGVGIGMNYT